VNKGNLPSWFKVEFLWSWFTAGWTQVYAVDVTNTRLWTCYTPCPRAQQSFSHTKTPPYVKHTQKHQKLSSTVMWKIQSTSHMIQHRRLASEEIISLQLVLADRT